MIFFSNMELRNSFHRKSSEVGAVASMPSPRENIWNCLAVPSTAIAPTCCLAKNHRGAPVTTNLWHLCSWKCLHGSFCSSFSKGATSLGFFSMLWRVKSQTKHNKTTVSPCFTKHILSHKSQKSPSLPPNTVPSNGIWLQGFALHSGIASSARNSTRFDDFICEAVKCEKLVAELHILHSFCLYSNGHRFVRLFFFFLQLQICTGWIFYESRVSKNICTELLPRSSDFW